MDIFSNREIATLLWLVVLAVYVLTKAEVRSSLFAVLKAFHWKIILSAVLMAIYIAVSVSILSIFEIWTTAQLKDTIIWVISAAFVSMFRVTGDKEKAEFFKNWVSDNLKITVLVEFIVALPSFSLGGEMIFIPTMMFLTALQACSTYKEEHKDVAKLLYRLNGFIGWLLICHAVGVIADNFGTYATLQTARDFGIPVLLSFLMIPFLYALYIYISYENAFVRVHFLLKDQRLQAYARKKAIIEFRFNVHLLNRWTRNIAWHRPLDKKGIRETVREAKKLWNRERHPPVVLSAEGWSPYKVNFLQEFGLITGDYHRSFDRWTASTSYLKIGKGFLPDNIAYYVDGDERAVTRLRIVLNVNNPTEAAASQATFREVAVSLLRRAIPESDATNIVDNLLKGAMKEATQHDKKISLTQDTWCGGIMGGYSLEFQIEHQKSAEDGVVAE